MEVYHSENCCCHEKHYFLFVSSDADAKVIVNFISMDCKCIRAKYEFDIADIDDYQIIENEIENFEAGTGKLKAGIFDLFGMKSTKKSHDFCKFWRRNFGKNGILYQFINSSTLFITSILHGSNIDISDIFFTLVHITKNEITVIDLGKSFDGGFIIKKQTALNLECSDKVLMDTVMKGKKSSKIILSIDDPSNKRKFENILKSPKLMILAKNYSNYILKALEGMINDLTGICKNKYKISPYFESNLFIIKQQKSDQFYGSFEMKCLKNEKLPFNKSMDILVAKEEIVVISILNGSSLEILETFDVSRYAVSHVHLNFLIGINGFHNLSIEPALNFNLLSFCKRQQDVYINFDDEDGKISITIPDIGKLKDGDDNTTISPYISFFDNGMPVIGEKAQKQAAQHPSFVVYDILALTKMAATSTIKTDPKWGFKVDKDSNGTLQVIFNTWRGTRKATPEFLLAVLINHLFKLAKDRLGFVPKVVDINVGDNFRYLENGIIAALKRLDEKYQIQSDRSKRINRLKNFLFFIGFKKNNYLLSF